MAGTDRAGQSDPDKGQQSDDGRPTFAPRALSIDLEVSKQDSRVFKLAAVRGDTGAALTATGPKEIAQALDDLERFAEGLTFLIGHNLLAFDAPQLRALRPDLSILALPMVDTLRLNPLAFPRNPYHRLVKHYQDGALQGGQLNDPELDARLVLQLFSDQWQALKTIHDTAPALLSAWHWLTTQGSSPTGMGAFFTTIRRQLRPQDDEATQAIWRFLEARACPNNTQSLLAAGIEDGWPLAFALAWIAVAGGNSVMSPWVLHQFPEAGQSVRRLRGESCGDPACPWCSERHDAGRELTRWFGFPGYRPEPADSDGKPLQRKIVEAAMARDSVLAILPTGTGKSLCYQIPALSRFDQTGALTVVISPLVALMSDQVTGLENRGIHSCVAINGMLSMPERSDALNRVRLGDAGIVLISPEQLRNRTVRQALSQREIGAWVLDEAHCLSKWGHDFRPDYRYVGRFIRERADGGEPPPILCLTATAKPEVVADILGHFQRHLNLELRVFDGGSARRNLDFSVIPTTRETKLPHLFQLLKNEMPDAVPGGAIVYCSTRNATELTAQYLRDQGLAAEHFHAGLDAEDKQSVQAAFLAGELRVIVATNAFGMGIDKPDVRLVIHADIPGSLENYLQEAGRAGRDQQAAQCVLLMTREDIEQQFSLSARSRLSADEIKAVLRSLRRLEKQHAGKHEDDTIVATTGEILAEEDQGRFVRDAATDDTRVRTAIAWLEESGLMSREENRVQMFPSSLQVANEAAARRLIEARITSRPYQKQLMDIVRALLDADADDGISTDELMLTAGLRLEGVRKAMADLEEIGVASNDMPLTSFVRIGIEDSSRKRLEQARALETALIDLLVEAAPDLAPGEVSTLQLRTANQRLKDEGHAHTLPAMLLRLLKSLAADGRSEDGGAGSLALRTFDSETVQVTLQRPWHALRHAAELRRDAAAVLLAHMEASTPKGVRGKDVLADTTLGKLAAALRHDSTLQGRIKHVGKLLDHALLWLHEQNVIRLHRGLTVFRPAMTIRLSPEKRNFNRNDYEPLDLHYKNQTLQIHIMAEYAMLGLNKMADALALAVDYFGTTQSEFLARWLPGREQELAMETTPESWQAIVEALHNRPQQAIVTDDRVKTNVLVLAGPGSGKTRVLVHRIAWLIRVKRERSQGILALAYNRHAAVEIRKRLKALIGDDAKGVTVMTCHALAMRLTGETLSGRRDGVDQDYFRGVLKRAARLLRGDDLPPEEADERREHLLGSFRWILVDEYQDIEEEQYELISALAGRTLADRDAKLSLFAVGDDDQNIYAFDGASVKYIRRFEEDFDARAAYLVENYRSTQHLIDFANAVIDPAAERMKAEQPIRINSARQNAAKGGRWEGIDPVGRGRVQVLPAVADVVSQALGVMLELQRLQELDPDWSWQQVAVIARHWRTLDPVRAYCEIHDIPVQLAAESTNWFWRLRETQQFADWLRSRAKAEPLISANEAQGWLALRTNTTWWDTLREAVSEWDLQTEGAEMPWQTLIEWLVEWGREMRRRQRGLLLTTAHGAKGLEFQHVAILDGDWDRVQAGKEDADAPRRLYYVAATRAMETLTLASLEGGSHLLANLPELAAIQRREVVRLPPPDPRMDRLYQRLTPADVDLGYAGRLRASHEGHAAIAALEAGAALTLRQDTDRWLLLDPAGTIVGRLAKSFSLPTGYGVESARVHAILIRDREDSSPEYQDTLRSDRWEVVLPEVVLLPDGHSPSHLKRR